MGFTMWRVAYAPLEIGFAKKLVSEALSDNDRGIRIDMQGVYLYWPIIRGPLRLELKGTQLFDESNRELLSIEDVSVGLSKSALLLGRAKPVMFSVNNVALHAIRHGAYEIDIGLGENADSAKAERNIIERILDVMAYGEGGQSNEFLSKFKELDIRNATLLVDDRYIGQHWSVPKADFTFIRTAVGLEAVFEMEFPSLKENPPVLEMRSVVSGDTGDVHIDGVLRSFSPALIAEKFPELNALKNHEGLLSAKVQANFNRSMDVQAADFAVISKKGIFRNPSWSAEGIPFKDFGLLLTYNEDSSKIDLRDAQITLGNVPISANGELTVSSDKKNIVGPLRVAISAINHAEIEPLWPQSLRQDNSYEWVVKKLSKGTISNAFAEALLVLNNGEDGWGGSVDKLNAGFEFENMDIDYRSPLIPASNARGTGFFDLYTEKLIIDIDEANISDMRVKSADLEFINIVSKGKGVADLKLDISTPLNTLLSYVQEEPLDVSVDFDPAKASGQAELDIQLNFPLVSDVPKEDVKVEIEGKLTEASVPNLVKGMTVKSQEMTARIKDGLFTISGKGQLDGRSADMKYEEYIIGGDRSFTSKVTANILGDEALRKKFGVDLRAFLSGPARVDVVYTSYGNNKSEAQIVADITESTLYLEPFSYEKMPGQKAEIRATAVLENDELQRIENLTGSAPSLTLEKSTLNFIRTGDNTELAGGQLSRFILGETVAALDFKVANDVWKMIIKAPMFDARPFLADKDQQEGKRDGLDMIISLNADRLRTTDDDFIKFARAYLDISEDGLFNQAEFDGVAGKGDMHIRFKELNTGRRVFEFEADDAGAALKALGLYSGINGGELAIYADPNASAYDRNLRGGATLTNFSVVDAPILARLLGLLSLPGLINSLDQEGLSFSKMEAEFDWLHDPNGSVLAFKNGRTAGNALGLTFDGTYDTGVHKIDVNGTIIPMSGVNNLIGSIPLLGDIITGGTGSLIAATYTMKGDAKDPDIFVNPLSVLAPGVLRRILFEE